MLLAKLRLHHQQLEPLRLFKRADYIANVAVVGIILIGMPGLCSSCIGDDLIERRHGLLRKFLVLVHLRWRILLHFSLNGLYEQSRWLCFLQISLCLPSLR